MNGKLDRGSPYLVPFLISNMLLSTSVCTGCILVFVNFLQEADVFVIDTAGFECFPNDLCNGVECLREVDRCNPQFDPHSWYFYSIILCVAKWSVVLYELPNPAWSSACSWSSVDIIFCTVLSRRVSMEKTCLSAQRKDSSACRMKHFILRDASFVPINAKRRSASRQEMAQPSMDVPELLKFIQHLRRNRGLVRKDW